MLRVFFVMIQEVEAIIGLIPVWPLLGIPLRKILGAFVLQYQADKFGRKVAKGGCAAALNHKLGVSVIPLLGLARRIFQIGELAG